MRPPSLQKRGHPPPWVSRRSSSGSCSWRLSGCSQGRRIPGTGGGGPCRLQEGRGRGPQAPGLAGRSHGASRTQRGEVKGRPPAQRHHIGLCPHPLCPRRPRSLFRSCNQHPGGHGFMLGRLCRKQKPQFPSWEVNPTLGTRRGTAYANLSVGLCLRPWLGG